MMQKSPTTLAHKTIRLESGDDVVACCYVVEDSAILDVTIIFNNLKHIGQLDYTYRLPAQQIDIMQKKVEAFDVESANMHMKRVSAEILAAHQLNDALEQSLRPNTKIDWDTLRQQHNRW